MKSVHIGPFLGMNNQLPQTQYNVPDEGDFVRDARNVDILDSGTLRRRSGYTKLLDGRFSSLYAMGSTALCVHDGYLCRVNALPNGQWNTVQLCPVRGTTVSYAPVGEQVFCTDGDSVWRYAGLSVVQNSVAVPQAPLVDVSTGGLPAGAYSFLCTRVRAYGEESAASAEFDVVLDGGHGCRWREHFQPGRANSHGQRHAAGRRGGCGRQPRQRAQQGLHVRRRSAQPDIDHDGQGHRGNGCHSHRDLQFLGGGGQLRPGRHHRWQRRAVSAGQR